MLCLIINAMIIHGYRHWAEPLSVDHVHAHHDVRNYTDLSNLHLSNIFYYFKIMFRDFLKFKMNVCKLLPFNIF